MDKRKKEVGYALWYRSALRNPRRELVGYHWVARTNRKATVSLEMAQALAADLTRCDVAWEIRDQAGNVVERSQEVKND